MTSDRAHNAGRHKLPVLARSKAVDPVEGCLDRLQRLEVRIDVDATEAQQQLEPG